MKKMPIEYLQGIENNQNLAVGRKWDGFSERLVISNGWIRLFNRSGKEHTSNVPALTSKMFIIPDCEIQAEGIGPSGRVASAKSILGSSPVRAIVFQDKYGPLKLVCHNLVELRGESLLHIQYGDRLPLLADLVASLNYQGLKIVFKEELITSRKYDYFQTVLAQGGEGVVIKDLKGLDVDFVKVKRFKTWDVIITGFTEGKGKYSTVIGAIRYGAYKDGILIEVGKCSGMTDAERAMFAASPDAFIGRVIEVKGQEIDSRGGIRFPAFQRIRDDKLPEECLIEDLVD
jgi:ATP-dependent DNA ligase